MMRAVKATILGGILFLIPCGLVVLATAKMFALLKSVAALFSAWFPVNSLIGIAMADILAVVFMASIAFAAGALASRPFGKRLYRPIDEKVGLLFPRYVFVKNMLSHMASEEDEFALKPVRVILDDQSQIAFEVERHAQGLVTVYVPGSPDPWSGFVAYVSPDRIEALNGDFNSVSKILRQAGRGASDLLR